MLKFKSIIPTVLSNLSKGGLKFYAKSAQQPQPALSSPDALGAKTEETLIKPAIKPLESNLAQSENSVAINETNEQLETVSSSSADKKPKGCKKIATSKGKKGKKCGQPKPPQPPKDPGPPGGFYIVDKCDMFDIPKTNSKKWRTISYTLLPFIVGLTAFVFTTIEEKPEPEYIPYGFMYRRTKRFPWRDGKKSLFHGPNNIIPEEEEERLNREADGKPIQYKKHTNELEAKIEKRKKHAQEELEKRKKRHEEESNTNGE